MTLESAYEGEDVPIRIEYTDSSGNPVNEDSTSSTAPTGPAITITETETSTESVSGTVMTNTETGSYEFVWDTSADTAAAGNYHIDVTGEFSGETKLAMENIKLF